MTHEVIMINIETLTTMFGDEEFTKMIFNQFLVDNGDVNKRIQKQVDENQSEALFHTMHTLSGALLSICEEDIVHTIKNVEALSRKGEPVDVKDINHIKIELDKIMLQMKDYLA